MHNSVHVVKLTLALNIMVSAVFTFMLTLFLMWFSKYSVYAKFISTELLLSLLYITDQNLSVCLHVC